MDSTRRVTSPVGGGATFGRPQLCKRTHQIQLDVLAVLVWVRYIRGAVSLDDVLASCLLADLPKNVWPLLARYSYMVLNGCSTSPRP